MSSHKQQVRWVDRTGQDTNAHFPLPRFWERTLLNPQHLCSLTILSEANRFHLSPLLSQGYRQPQTLLKHQVSSSHGVWDVRLKSSALDRACRGPERARIDPIRIEREHLVVQLALRRL